MKLYHTKPFVTLFIMFIFVALITQTGCGEGKKQKNEQTPVFVDAVTITPTLWQPKIDVTGTLKAEQGVIIKTEIAGRVTQIAFTSGDTVEKGTLLVQLNPDILRAQVNLYKSDLQLKKLVFGRVESLYKKATISKTEYDKALAEYEVAQAEFERASAQLDQTKIRAPFDGTTGLNLVDSGDYIAAGTPLVSLQDINPMRVDFSVPEIYLSKIKVGQKITIKVDAHKDQSFAGNVIAFDSQVNPQTRMLAVRGSLPNEDKKLTPGMFAEVSLYLGKKQPTIMIPKIAIVSSEKGDFIYKIMDGKAKKTNILAGTGDEDNIVIVEGVQSGDTVITAGQLKLKNGSPVAVAEKTEETS